MAYDPTALSHQEWIGYVQPVGVVVSTPALLEAGAAINRNSVPLHREFLAVLPQDGEGNAVPKLTDFPRFAIEVLKWRPEDLAVPDESLTHLSSGLRRSDLRLTTWSRTATPLLLISKAAGDFDALPAPEPRHWHASPQARFERLLRETSIPAGLLISPDAIRLVYAPKGESSGHITFKVVKWFRWLAVLFSPPCTCFYQPSGYSALADEQRLPALLLPAGSIKVLSQTSSPAR